MKPHIESEAVLLPELNDLEMSRDLRPVVNLAYQPVASGSSVAMIPEVAGPKLEFNSYPLFALTSDAIWEAGLNSFDAQTKSLAG